jgi:calcineurin-like phosphoesterase family protein
MLISSVLTVHDQDEVWYLGEFATGTMEQVAKLLSQLNGDKHLIIGNKDSEATLKAADGQAFNITRSCSSRTS